MAHNASHAAHELLEVAPAIMRAIRNEMRSHRPSGLTVTQFRVMEYLRRHPGAALNEVAAHSDLTPPTMSKLIAGLVARKIVTRVRCDADRRRVTLALTQRGETMLEATRHSAMQQIAAQLQPLSEDERLTIVTALQILAPVFQP